MAKKVTERKLKIGNSEYTLTKVSEVKIPEGVNISRFITFEEMKDRNWRMVYTSGVDGDLIPKYLTIVPFDE